MDVRALAEIEHIRRLLEHLAEEQAFSGHLLIHIQSGCPVRVELKYIGRPKDLTGCLPIC